MINTILKKYYYYKYLWTIKKSTASVSAILDIESTKHPELTKNIRVQTELAQYQANPNKEPASVVSIKRDPQWN
jgi:hypothetical protein